MHLCINRVSAGSQHQPTPLRYLLTATICLRAEGPRPRGIGCPSVRLTFNLSERRGLVHIFSLVAEPCRFEGGSGFTGDLHDRTCSWSPSCFEEKLILCLCWHPCFSLWLRSWFRAMVFRGMSEGPARWTVRPIFGASNPVTTRRNFGPSRRFCLLLDSTCATRTRAVRHDVAECWRGSLPTSQVTGIDRPTC